MAALSQSAWQYPFSTYKELYLENRTAGHRKFYKMMNNDRGRWTAEWGPIGSLPIGHQKYDSHVWESKLTEKLKKGYVLERATSFNSTTVPSGTPVPVVPSSKLDGDDDIKTDPVILAKIDRIILFLEDKMNGVAMNDAEEIKLSYIQTGVLTKKSMETLNILWIKHGGGRW